MNILHDAIERGMRLVNTDRELPQPEVATLPAKVATPAASGIPSLPGYEILGELGRGSMGVVYKARQAGIDRIVALKMILAGDRASPEAFQRFLAEARVVASLKHPNIIQIFEVNFEQNCPYYSMELVEDGTLADRLGGQPQPPKMAAQLVLILARAIHVAHKSGIVHRDLKPANILLACSVNDDTHVRRVAAEMGLPLPNLGLGTPKITDFGLAKQLHDDARQTESGMIMGTPSYMAPEQAEGKSSEVGPAADIYALGAILYEMLTGRAPFTAESPMETLLQIFQAEPVAPSRLQPKIARDLETIVLKCLHKEPQRRYLSAEDLADDLQRFLNHQPIKARPVSLREKTWKWLRRHPALAIVIYGSVLSVCALLALVLWHQMDLEVKLGQALIEERDARTATEEISERERLGVLRHKIQELLQVGETALMVKDWSNARLQLMRARDQAANEPELADLPPRVEGLLQQIAQQHADHDRLQKFRALHDEALFQATLFTGGDLALALKATRSSALEALTLFGIALESKAGPDVSSRHYLASEKTEIVAGCFELLVVLADAVALTPASRSENRRRLAEKALLILDRAALLGVSTQAFHRRRAQFLTLTGQKDLADHESRRAEAMQPTTPLDHFLLGQDQYRQGKNQDAVQAFENVLQLQPNHFWANYYLALCCLKTERPGQAAACLTACLGQRRDFPWLYLLRASAWSEMGQFERAEADFEVALKAPLPDATRYGLLINRGVLRIRQGRLDLAQVDLQKAVTLRPEQHQGYVNLAQMHLKGKQLDQAVEQLDEAIEREPGLAFLYRTRARIHLLRQDPDAALADLERALGLAKGSQALNVANDHFERARLWLLRKKPAQALADCDESLRLRPQEARVYRLRAEVLLELERWPEALQSLDACLKYGPAEAGVFRARAALRTRLGQYAGAQTDYTRAVEIEPEAVTYAERGWCFLVADAPKLALPDFEEALQRAPDLGDAYAGRGLARVLLGHPRPAVADAEEAQRLGPATPRHFYNLARIYGLALARLDNDPQRTRWSVEAWQDRALQLLTKALDSQPPAEAALFWQTVIRTDKAMNPLRRFPAFDRLAARYPLRQIRPVSGTTPHSTLDQRINLQGDLP